MVAARPSVTERSAEMKRIVLPLVLAGVLLASMLSAEQTRAAAATIVVGTSTCGVTDSNANCVTTPFKAIVTQSATGVEIERYSADGVFNDTGHAVVFKFADFGPPFGYCVSEITGVVTTDWVESLSASGHASIVCRFKG
jgi:hypothetical protein